MKMKMLALAFSTLVAQSAFAAGAVNVYSNRQDELIRSPSSSSSRRRLGSKVNGVCQRGLNERLEREGKLSPADLMLTVDISRLTELVDRDLVQPVDSKTLQENIPPSIAIRTTAGSALTTGCVPSTPAKERLGKLDTIRYEDLVKPEFKGKICTCSGKHEYNVALVSSMIAHHGMADTKTWLEGQGQPGAQAPGQRP